MLKVLKYNSYIDHSYEIIYFTENKLQYIQKNTYVHLLQDSSAIE